MKSTDISIEEWKALYQAAKEFRKIRPWEWATEADIFGVQNPLTNEIGYCCIMGEIGEFFSLAVYLGTGGLQGYLDILEGVVEPNNPDAMFIQDCLIVSFEDRDVLLKEDKALVKQLGLKFRGERAWPLFRRYEPGYFPWFLGKEEVGFLTLVLQQAKDICLRLKKDEALLDTPKENAYLVMMQDPGTGAWKDAWLKSEPLKKKIHVPVVIDNLRLQRLKKKSKSSTAAWEVDFFYSLNPVEDERPYYPYAMMIADRDTGFIHTIHLSDRFNYPAEFTSQALTCIEDAAEIPSEIFTKKEEVYDLLKPITIKLNIKLRKVGRLPAIDEARRSMGEYMEGGGPLTSEYCGDDEMEEYLDSAGSELSIFGLYGLLYGCLAAPDLVGPSQFISIILGKEGAGLETEKEIDLVIGNVMALWKIISQWDHETEDLIIPEYVYDRDVDGAITHIADILELAGYFLSGLELGGISSEALFGKMEEDADSIVKTTALLYAYSELLEKETGQRPNKLKETLKAIDQGEFLVAGCIANISTGLKKARLSNAQQFSLDTETGRRVYSETSKEAGRNDPCPCGSGKKYKKCCGLVH